MGYRNISNEITGLISKINWTMSNSRERANIQVDLSQRTLGFLLIPTAFISAFREALASWTSFSIPRQLTMRQHRMNLRRQFTIRGAQYPPRQQVKILASCVTHVSSSLADNDVTGSHVPRVEAVLVVRVSTALRHHAHVQRGRAEWTESVDSRVECLKVLFDAPGRIYKTLNSWRNHSWVEGLESSQTVTLATVSDRNVDTSNLKPAYFRREKKNPPIFRSGATLFQRGTPKLPG